MRRFDVASLSDHNRILYFNAIFSFNSGKRYKKKRLQPFVLKICESKSKQLLLRSHLNKNVVDISEIQSKVRIDKARPNE